ncbi:hypothetical protein WM15_32150 [Burkholderia ubonensis]|nr:hypothetical protein WM15_32150 [Burkholderia ubonensis]
MEVTATAEAIVEQPEGTGNETSSKFSDEKSRADALTDLLPCPFCGADATTSARGKGASWHPIIACVNWCCSVSGTGGTREVMRASAVKLWNMRASLAASPVEQPAQLMAQDALAAIETFEIVGDNNDSREPNADDRFILTEFIAHAFGGYPIEQPAAAPAIELSRVKETLESGGGFWRTCSGCHESEDGHPVGEYPYSEVLQCDLGAGCAECGGIGAVWDNTDYDDMAAFLDRQEEAAEASQSAAAPADERAAFIEAYVQTFPPENRAVDPDAPRRFAESVIEARGPSWQLWLAGIAYACAGVSRC